MPLPRSSWMVCGHSPWGLDPHVVGHSSVGIDRSPLWLASRGRVETPPALRLRSRTGLPGQCHVGRRRGLRRRTVPSNEQYHPPDPFIRSRNEAALRRQTSLSPCFLRGSACARGQEPKRRRAGPWSPWRSDRRRPSSLLGTEVHDGESVGAAERAATGRADAGGFLPVCLACVSPRRVTSASHVWARSECARSATHALGYVCPVGCPRRFALEGSHAMLTVPGDAVPSGEAFGPDARSHGNAPGLLRSLERGGRDPDGRNAVTIA